MKKTVLLFLACTLYMATGFSQTKEKGYFAVSLGPAFPTSKFAGNNVSDPLAGLAKTGAAISVSYSKMFSPYIGIAVQLQGQRNPVNTTVIKKYFEDLTGYSNWNFDKAGWSYGALMVGPESQMPIGKTNKLQFVARIMAGAAYTKSPAISGQSKTDNTSGHVEQDNKTATGFILNTMAGLNYSTSKAVFLTAAISYSGTNKMTFKQVKTTVTTTQGTAGSGEYAVQRSSHTVDGKQSISSINILLGIGFRF